MRSLWNRVDVRRVQGVGGFYEGSGGVTRWWVTGVVGAMVLVGGCGDSTSDAPVADAPTSTAAAPTAAEPWDPCTIPNSAIEIAGLDVESKSTNLFGGAPLSNDWKTCIWTDPDPGSWYFLGLFSSAHDLGYVKANDQFDSFTAADEDGFVQFRRTAKYDEVSCGIAYEVTGGIVYFILDGRAGRKPLGDPCSEIGRVTKSLQASLPARAR
ncbi:DUF3558 family protein [Rhodococcus ruber]|uniref:DUF3558 family protein n=1 Tax=Rhodococcus ruber TaxID=1830 RepID=A0ABT4MLR9_9NOCA|nr:DUF3558 family protein [Rhodococcus ruber]MCZ4521305.1 DUF3558 family protein [Rhodococcus ruber]